MVKRDGGREFLSFNGSEHTLELYLSTPLPYREWEETECCPNK